MNQSMTFVQDDRKPDIVFGLKDIDSLPIDVSAETTAVTFYFKQVNVNGVPKTGSIVLSKVSDGLNGQVLLEWGETDLDTPGKYVGEIEIDYDGIRHTLPFLIDFVNEYPVFGGTASVSYSCDTTLITQVRMSECRSVEANGAGVAFVLLQHRLP